MLRLWLRIAPYVHIICRLSLSLTPVMQDTTISVIDAISNFYTKIRRGNGHFLVPWMAILAK